MKQWMCDGWWEWWAGGRWIRECDIITRVFYARLTEWDRKLINSWWIAYDNYAWIVRNGGKGAETGCTLHNYLCQRLPSCFHPVKTCLWRPIRLNSVVDILKMFRTESWRLRLTRNWLEFESSRIRRNEQRAYGSVRGGGEYRLPKYRPSCNIALAGSDQAGYNHTPRLGFWQSGMGHTLPICRWQ